MDQGKVVLPSFSELPEFPGKNLLSAREGDVLVGIVHGLSSKEVAYRLGISQRTVDNHRDSIFKKLKDIKQLRFTNTVSLVRVVYSLDILPTERQ